MRGFRAAQALGLRASTGSPPLSPGLVPTLVGVSLAFVWTIAGAHAARTTSPLTVGCRLRSRVAAEQAAAQAGPGCRPALRTAALPEYGRLAGGCRYRLPGGRRCPVSASGTLLPPATRCADHGAGPGPAVAASPRRSGRPECLWWLPVPGLAASGLPALTHPSLRLPAVTVSLPAPALRGAACLETEPWEAGWESSGSRASGDNAARGGDSGGGSGVTGSGAAGQLLLRGSRPSGGRRVLGTRTPWAWPHHERRRRRVCRYRVRRQRSRRYRHLAAAIQRRDRTRPLSGRRRRPGWVGRIAHTWSRRNVQGIPHVEAREGYAGGGRVQRGPGPRRAPAHERSGHAERPWPGRQLVPARTRQTRATAPAPCQAAPGSSKPVPSQRQAAPSRPGRRRPGCRSGRLRAARPGQGPAEALAAHIPVTAGRVAFKPQNLGHQRRVRRGRCAAPGSSPMQARLRES